MSKFVVSARKYRPITFDEVVGQIHIAKTLKNALQNDKLAHAFLFCGPRGVGKTTCARILAKVINCENTKDKVEPCNECNSCISFNENASFNILELDAASNNSVEHIRTLIEQVRFPPQSGTHKVFIIDEVHMLSSQAFNAFLKTLEEPPPYAIFILATTEKHKIIPTILSRCQIYDFKRIQINDIVEQLLNICNQEGITAEKEALHMIAQKADGAMRDALSIFDKISGASEGNITYKETIANLNILDYEYYFKLTDAFLREDFSDVLIIFNEILNNGFEPEQVVNGLGEHFRELLISKDPKTLNLMEVSESIKEKYFNQALISKSSFLLSGLNLLNQCEIQLAIAKNRRLHTEICLSKITFSNKIINQDQIVSYSEEEKKTKIANSPSLKDVKIEVKEAMPAIEKTPAEANNKNKEKNTVKEPIKILNTPAFSSVETILNKINADEKKSLKAKENFNLDSIKEIWEEYAVNNPSKSVELACSNAILMLNEKELVVIVPNALAKDIINQEPDLISRIREQLGTPEMTVSYEIDPEKFPDYMEAKPKLKLSTREIYDMMVEKNNNIKLLVKSLNLVPDSGIPN
jgi:DNA polymerase-3 subunit gamma/tau